MSFVADRYSNLGNGAGFKPPVFECLDGEFVEQRAAGALEHSCVSHCSRRAINGYGADAASGEIAPFISYVYSGKGAVIAKDCASERDIGTGAGMFAASGCTAGRGRFLGRGFLSAGTAATRASSAGAACPIGVAGF